METYHTLVTKENLDILSEWRFCDNKNKLLVNQIVGWARPGNKGHNPKTDIIASGPNGYNFGTKVTFEEFCRLENIKINSNIELILW